jgi:hypothetical protein
VKRVKPVLVTVAAMAVMMVAAASPALASHGWEWTPWWQWGDTDWWCTSLWFHDENDEWGFDRIFCANTETGDAWWWPS